MESTLLMTNPSTASWLQRPTGALKSSVLALALALVPCAWAIAQPSPSTVQELPRLPEDFGKAQEQPEAAVKLFLEGWAGIEYDDNVLRSPVDPKSDTAYIVAPRIRVKSFQEKFHWDATAGLEAADYQRVSGDDYVDYDIGWTSTWIVTEASTLVGFAKLRKDHQLIGDNPGDPERNAKEATKFWRGDLGLDWTFKPNRWLFDLGANARYFNYDNTERDDGTLIFEDDRDRTEFDPLVRVGYRVTAKLQPYVYGAYNVRSYRNNIENIEPFDRDSHGFASGVGIAYGAKQDDLFADFSIGYLHQSYSAAIFRDVNDFGIHGEIAWRITPRFTLAGDVDRSLQETTLDAASSYLLTRTQVSATYDLLQNVSLIAKGRYADYDFQIDEARTQKPGRNDDVYELGLGVKWRLPHDLFFDVYYNFKNRDSTDAGVEYDSHAVRLAIGAQF
ncbi:MAG: outer membrane beta-barrel protein [Gammaproteobacteria bacterium]